jgi:hypothetical protein
MAATFDNTVNIGSSGSVLSLLTGSFTITSNSNVAATLSLGCRQDTVDAFTASLGGVGGTAITGADKAVANVGRTLMFGVLAPPSGSQTATVSWSTSSTATLGVITAYNVNQGGVNSGTFNNGTNASGGGSAATINITSTNGDLTHDCTLTGQTSVLPTAPTQTARWTTAGGTTVTTGGSTGPGTGTATHAWTVDGAGSNGWIVAGVNFVQSVGGLYPALERRMRGVERGLLTGVM